MAFIFYFFFSMFLCFFLLVASYLASLSSLLIDLEKGSPFESGFCPMVLSGYSFSMPFFVISIMFLLFDVELLLLCFYPYYSFSSGTVFFFSYFVVALVFISTIYEWSKGILSWV